MFTSLDYFCIFFGVNLFFYYCKKERKTPKPFFPMYLFSSLNITVVILFTVPDDAYIVQ
jgi:hypothetical protein